MEEQPCGKTSRERCRRLIGAPWAEPWVRRLVPQPPGRRPRSARGEPWLPLGLVGRSVGCRRCVPPRLGGRPDIAYLPWNRGDADCGTNAGNDCADGGNARLPVGAAFPPRARRVRATGRRGLAWPAF